MKTPLVTPFIPIIPNKCESPMATTVRAFDELFSGNQSGQIVEAPGSNSYYQKQQEYPNEIAKWVWDDGPAFWARKIAKLGSS
jgi:hypothetical protein